MPRAGDPEFRLAMCEDGEWWVGYLAGMSTMDDALELGRIRLRSVVGNPARKQAFLDLLIKSLTDEIALITGSPVQWEIKIAPAHERR